MGKRYHIFGTETPNCHAPRWWRVDGLCTEDEHLGILYEESLFDLDSQRKKSESRGYRKPSSKCIYLDE